MLHVHLNCIKLRKRVEYFNLNNSIELLVNFTWIYQLIYHANAIFLNKSYYPL